MGHVASDAAGRLCHPAGHRPAALQRRARVGARLRYRTAAIAAERIVWVRHPALL